MMSDPNTVDGTTVDDVTGRLVLLIDERRPWHEPDLLHRQLAAKVKHYVRYIRSKEFKQEHGRPSQDTVVRLVVAEPPSESSVKFFERVSYELKKHGITFEHEVGQAETGLDIGEAPTAQPPRSFRPDDTGPGPAPPPVGEEIIPSTTPFEAAEVQDPDRTVPMESLETGAGSAADPDSGLGDGEDSVGDETGETETERLDFIGFEETQGETEAPASGSSPTHETGEDHTPPPFFPEEEFGRASPKPSPDDESLFIETPSGRHIRVGSAQSLDDPDLYKDVPTTGVSDIRPSLLRGIAGAITAAVAAAVIWGLLAVIAPDPKATSALTLVVGLMVGISVRLRGAGHTFAFRVVGVLGTLLGCFLGATLASAALASVEDGTSFAGITQKLSSLDTALAALSQYYQLTDILLLALLGLGVYIGFKLSASKPV